MNANKKSSLSQMSLSRILTQGIVIAVFLLVAIFSVRSGMYVLGMALSLAPLFARFLTRPESLLMLALFVNAARIKMPTLASGASFTPILLLLLIAILVVGRVLSHKKKSMRTGRVGLLIFTAAFTITAAVRGFGFAFLGGSVIGGMTYVTMMVPVLLYFAMTDMSLNDRDIKFMVIGLGIAGTLPFLVQYFVSMAGLQFTWLSHFFSFSVERIVNATDGADTLGTMRFETLVGFSLSLLPLTLVLRPRNRFLLFLVRLLWVICVFALLKSGFRRYFIGLFFVTGGYFLIISKSKMKTILLMATMGVAMVVFAYIAAPMLPFSAQRAVAFLPGIDISHLALHSATHSTEWRFELWSQCVENLPRYLWVGRGALMSLDEVLYSFSSMARMSGDMALYYYSNHGYHSGVFDVLLDFGILGFVGMILFHIQVIIKEALLGIKVRQDSLAGRYLIVLSLYSIWLVVAFWGGGGITRALPEFILITIQMVLIRRYMEGRELKKNEIAVGSVENGLRQSSSEREE